VSRAAIVRLLVLVVAVAGTTSAWTIFGTAPVGAVDTQASAQAATADNTVYVANETSGTVSVISTATNSVVATICLGSDPAIPGTPQPDGPCNAEADHHRPFYDGHVAPHGLWLTPDGTFLLVANRISGTIVAVDTRRCNGLDVAGCPGVLGYAPVGREPHLATVRPGGREAWVAVRGESYVDVLKLDPDDLTKPGLLPTARMEHRAQVPTAPGPSMVSFDSNGSYAFVAHGKARSVHKIDTTTRQVVATRTILFPFTPFGLVTPDDQELYLVHKGAGSLSVLRTHDLTEVASLPVGPCANHVAFVARLAYVTTGGTPPCAPGGTDREGKIVIVDQDTRAIVRELTGPAWTGDPHGIWASSDGQRLYVGHERGNRVTVIDLGNPADPLDDSVAATITDPLMKQPIDLVVKR
jgi:YVTN family beta-propeller protein